MSRNYLGIDGESGSLSDLWMYISLDVRDSKLVPWSINNGSAKTIERSSSGPNESMAGLVFFRFSISWPIFM